MKRIAIDMAYKSLNHYGEELCGDKVEIVDKEDSRILILADGMGSGIRANILATLTSKIIATMMYNDMSIDEVVATIAKTLPLSSVNVYTVRNGHSRRCTRQCFGHASH